MLLVPAFLLVRKGWKMLREGIQAQDNKITVAVAAATLNLSTALDNANKAIDAKDKYIDELERQLETERERLKRLAPNVLETAGRMDEIERMVRELREGK